MSKSLETVSVSVSPTLNYWIGNSLVCFLHDWMRRDQVEFSQKSNDCWTFRDVRRLDLGSRYHLTAVEVDPPRGGNGEPEKGAEKKGSWALLREKIVKNVYPCTLAHNSTLHNRLQLCCQSVQRVRERPTAKCCVKCSLDTLLWSKGFANECAFFKVSFGGCENEAGRFYFVLK